MAPRRIANERNYLPSSITLASLKCLSVNMIPEFNASVKSSESNIAKRAAWPSCSRWLLSPAHSLTRERARELAPTGTLFATPRNLLGRARPGVRFECERQNDIAFHVMQLN